jgi:type II secretory pathway pseudopilin PulG
VVVGAASVRVQSIGRRAKAGQRGISLLEVLFGGIVLAVALLGHVASTFHEYRLAREEQTRSEVLAVARQFMERMRSDEDFAGMYQRLRTLQDLAAAPTVPGERLEDGRLAFPPTAYYPDFVLPELLASLGVLVDVPFDPAAPASLREDVEDPRFGLPADLDGDGTIDDLSHRADYEALPVLVHLRWRPHGEAAHQMRLATWLRGYR